MTEQLPSGGDVGPWRCFHCEEIFTTRDEAAEHFGWSEHDEPGCKLNALEGGLLKLYREAMAELRAYREEDHPTQRMFYALAAEHYQKVQRAEEQGYAKGLADNSDREELTAALTASEAERERLTGFVATLIDQRDSLLRDMQASEKAMDEARYE